MLPCPETLTLVPAGTGTSSIPLVTLLFRITYPGGLMRRGARLRRQVAASVGMNLRVVEDRRRVAKNKIHAALNIGVNIILPAVVRKQSVLVPKKPAALEDRSIRAHRRRNCLAGITRGVFKSKIVGFKTRAVDLNSLRKKRSARLLCVQAVRNHHIRRRFPGAHKRNVGMVLRHNHALVINARLNLDKHAPMLAILSNTGKRMMIHRHLDGRKFRRPLDARLHIRRNPHMYVLREYHAGMATRAKQQSGDR